MVNIIVSCWDRERKMIQEESEKGVACATNDQVMQGIQGFDLTYIYIYQGQTYMYLIYLLSLLIWALEFLGFRIKESGCKIF